MSRPARSTGGDAPGALIRYVVPAYVATATVAVIATIGWAVARGAAPGHDGTCVFHVGAALSGSAEFFREHVAPGCPDLTVAGARTAVAWDFAFAFLYGLLGTLALRWLWPRAWRIARVRAGLAWLAWAPAATAVADLVENAFVLRGLRDAGAALSLVELDASVAGVAGWWKWTLATIATAAFAAALLGALGNARTPHPPADGATAAGPPALPDAVPSDVGIGLSGEGIRAAAFSIGTLRALDDRRLFRRAGFLAAVSGGAYAAAAWCVGRGSAREAPAVRPQPADGRDRLFRPPPGDPDVYAHVRAHRRYLEAGRGGAVANAVVALAFAALNLLALGVSVCLVAWPLGRFASSWVVQPDLRLFDYRTVSVQSLWVEDRLWLPGLAGLGVAGVVLVVSLFLWNPGRRVAIRVAGGFAALGALLLACLVALPVVLAELPKVLQEELPWQDRFDVATLVWLLAALGFAGTLVRLVRRPLRPGALRACRIVLSVPAVVLPAKVAADAAYGDGAFSWSPQTYALVLGGFFVFCLVASPQSWALFRLHYLRLRSAFATTQKPSARAAGAPGHGGVYPVAAASEPQWPELRARPGPKLLVCASAHRSHDPAEAVTMTFSEDAVSLRETEWDSAGMTMRALDHVVDAAAYAGLLRGPWPGSARLGTVTAAAAMSGSALTSGQGRQSLGGSNALLGALNVRLGAWMPNPRHPSDVRLGRPRLGYLFKEILGIHDRDDAYVYVSDGGRWGNLALVELVRRQCKWIFCLDAGSSQDGDDPLEDARALAALESGAEIDLDLSKLRAPEGGVPESSVAVGLVRYHTCGGTGRDGCETGLLLYGRPILARDVPIQSLSFSSRDRLAARRPGYDRFLQASEFDNLTRLGEWVGRRLAIEYERLPRALAAGSPDELAGAPALLEMYERLRGVYVPR